ncbi:cupin-like domain-containing protein [Alteriqipengyuania sp. 357]
MTVSPSPIDEHEGPITPGVLAEIRAAGRPVVMRGLVADWPAVSAARESDEAIVRYILQGGVTRPVVAMAAPPSEKGRFFYKPDLTGLNFMKGQGHLQTFLQDLLRAGTLPDAPAMAVQSEPLAELLPTFARDNRLDLLPSVEPRIWIGNRIQVAPHFDIKENIAVCVAGQRRFTLFPPGQAANLYPGPFELTPAGTPVSMVDIDGPDFAAFPRFAEAMEHATAATLDPGDAIYIPYCWWHGVRSLAPVSILVNYWWTQDQPHGIGSPYDGLLHAILAFRHLPPEQREAWRGLLDYYVFDENGTADAHLPHHAKGVLGPPSPGLFDRIRGIIRSALQPRG